MLANKELYEHTAQRFSLMLTHSVSMTLPSSVRAILKRYISAFPSASSSRSLSDFSQSIDKNELVCLNQNNHETREYNTKRFVDPGTNRACQQLHARIAVWSKSFSGSKAIPFQDSLMELRWKKAQTWDRLQNPSASTCNLLTLVAISHPMSVCLFEMLTLELA